MILDELYIIKITLNIKFVSNYACFKQKWLGTTMFINEYFCVCPQVYVNTTVIFACTITVIT